MPPKAYPALKEPVDPHSSSWSNLPYVSRRDLADQSSAFRTEHMPPTHGVAMPVQSGGSTGRPVQIALSALESVARIVTTYRMFIAWEMVVSRPLFMIRKPQIGSERRDGPGFRKWGFPWYPEDELGARHHIDIHTDPATQLARIGSENPAYVNTLPSNILRMGMAASALEEPPLIPFMISVAEYLPDEVKRLAEKTFGSRVINVLSSSEGGVIAIECPASGLLHLQQESVLAEIIKNDGTACQTGEVGELVVTPLYNYATPLIRYRSGDFVERGPACSCGRTLPTIAKVVGRREHMFSFPDGRVGLPPIDRVRITEIVGHEGWVFTQTSPSKAELRVTDDRYERRERELHSLLREAIDSSLSVSLKTVPSLPLTSGGKRHFCVNAMA
jgi:phenylacetate-CoA ligase